MISKLPCEKHSKKKFQIMFQICVLDQKIKEKNQCYVVETFFKCNDEKHQNIKYFKYY
jgi:hypothetical protein